MALGRGGGEGGARDAPDGVQAGRGGRKGKDGRKRKGLGHRLTVAKELTKKGGEILDAKITQARTESRKVIKREGMTVHRMMQFAVFFTVFTLIYLLINYYVVSRLGGTLGLSRTRFLYAALLLTLTFPVAQLIERYLANRFSRLLYILASIWMGVLFFLFVTVVAYEVLGLFLALPARESGLFILAFVAILSLGALINNLFVTVKSVEIPIPGLQRETRLVQLSDIHYGTIRNSAFLKRIVRATNALNADAVLVTGDLVDGSAPMHPGMFDELNRLEAPAYYVTGNHEEYEGVDDVFAILSSTNLRILSDSKEDFGGLQIVGVDYSYDKRRLEKVLPTLSIDRNRPAILLYHVPEGAEQARQNGISLQLSGHTHDGQLFPFNFLVRLAFKNVKGLYDFGAMKLYVSPGTSTWGPPMRLGSRNEITLLDLKPA